MNRDNDIEGTVNSLNEIVRGLEPKKMYGVIRNSIRSEMRKAARKVANQGISSELDVDPVEFRKHSVRGRSYKSLQGGFVSIRAGNQYMGLNGQYKTRHKYKNGRDRYKPIAMWAESGTRERFTKRGESRGKMPAYRFFTNGPELMDGAIDRIGENVEKRVTKLINKHGK